MSEQDQVELFGRIMLALALGALVGLQREFRGHEAGIRTTGLVCMGSAIFGFVSQEFGDDRVAAGVVQGIGFIGGGLIFRQGSNVLNLTTATTVWAMAAVGLMVARDLWLTAVLLTAAIVVLLEFAPISDWVYRTGGHDPEEKLPSPEEREPRHRG